MKKVLRIKNLDCPVCAGELQEDLSKITGTNEVKVDYFTQTISFEYENEDTIEKVIAKVNSFEEVQVIEDKKEDATSHRKEWLQIGISFLLAVIGYLLLIFWKVSVGEIFAYTIVGAGYLIVGYPVFYSTFLNVKRGRIFDENFLMTIASIGAIMLGEIVEGFAVLFLYQLGELLQSIAVGASRRSVKELMDMKTETAVLLKDGRQIFVSPEELKVGDIVLIKVGEKVPADGILLSESALLDTKALTGEFELKTVKKGEEILSGSINVGGMYEMKIIRCFEDSAVGKILDLMENASSKAKPEKFITRFAKIYTPIVCVLAVFLAAFAPILSGLITDGRFYFREYSKWITSGLTFLVISCPCALVISVPLTYFLGLGQCAKLGALVKGATCLEVLSKVKTVAFDKTGTLTKGDFHLLKMSLKHEADEGAILAMVASLERTSSHPLSKAFDGIETEYRFDNVKEIAGQGLIGETEGGKLLVGNGRLLKENGIEYDEVESLYTVIYVAFNGEYLGWIEVGDMLREEALEAILEMKNLGVENTEMLTGDSKRRAEAVAVQVGVERVYSELLPDLKLEMAKNLKEKGALLYVGDGINDAPVMMVADCSVSMGKLGSAAAIEESDVVLISENLKILPEVIKTARKTKRIVFENIIFSIVMKVLFMVLGIVGIPMYMAVFADVGVMLLAVCNAFRVRKIKKFAKK